MFSDDEIDTFLTPQGGGGEAPPPLPSDEEMIAKASLDIDHLFNVLRDGNEPLAEVVTKNNRRSKVFADKKERAQRLASIMMGLTPQQQRFVTHYVAKDWDTISEVMIRAGSTGKGDALRQIAWGYLNKPEIKEAIVLSTLRKLEAEGIDRYEIISMLRDSFNGAMADGRYKEANEAAQLLGTGIGMFNVKGGTLSKDLTKMETAQLGDMNRIARKAGLADEKPEASLARDEMQGDMVHEELSNALKIASASLKPH